MKPPRKDGKPRAVGFDVSDAKDGEVIELRELSSSDGDDDIRRSPFDDIADRLGVRIDSSRIN